MPVCVGVDEERDLASESPAAIPGAALSKQQDDLGKVTWLLSPKAVFANIGRKFSPFLGIWVFRCYYPKVLNILPNGTNAVEIWFFGFFLILNFVSWYCLVWSILASDSLNSRGWPWTSDPLWICLSGSGIIGVYHHVHFCSDGV